MHATQNEKLQGKPKLTRKNYRLQENKPNIGTLGSTSSNVNNCNIRMFKRFKEIKIQTSKINHATVINSYLNTYLSAGNALCTAYIANAAYVACFALYAKFTSPAFIAVSAFIELTASPAYFALKDFVAFLAKRAFTDCLQLTELIA